MRRGWDRFQGYGVALLRVTLGVYYLLHAHYGFWWIGIDRFIQMNAGLGIPFPAVTAWFVILGHLIGGAMLLLGFYTRFGALLNIIVMAGAVGYVHFKQGFFMHGIIVDAAAGRANYGGYEYALFLLIATVAVLLLGSGSFALNFSRPSRISLD